TSACLFTVSVIFYLLTVVDVILPVRSLSFLFFCHFDHRYLHSFPTRRSSDLRSACGPTLPRRGCRTSCRLLRYTAARASCASWRSEDTRLNSSHVAISYAVLCLKKKNF